ncbi:NAD(P)-dependent oxidoreductase [Deinococcus aquaedulcis]|uniref:NAD(P)-dependent oxidoreductase n=1 Tax=Deinococcus aquaedulcis TaxID=2840455 RepID=UPI001C8282A9|nr:NAD(P)H-binding protein [Deinococcus aquaedulcis]
MKLALLGATGRTGRLVLDQALARGHEVQALARRPEVLSTRPGLTVVAGHLKDEAALQAVLRGADAVLSALGPVKGDAGGVMTQAAQVLVRRMPEAGVRRVVSLTGAGVPFAGDVPGPVDHIFRTLLRVLQGDVLRDATEHVRLLRTSDLDWTVVRAPMLTDGPAGPVRSGPVGRTGPRVPRASVAAFMLDAAEQGTFSRQAPAVSA